ncbi:unnamed protein product [Natator depressus]
MVQRTRGYQAGQVEIPCNGAERKGLQPAHAAWTEQNSSHRRHVVLGLQDADDTPTVKNLRQTQTQPEARIAAWVESPQELPCPLSAARVSGLKHSSWAAWGSSPAPAWAASAENTGLQPPRAAEPAPCPTAIPSMEQQTRPSMGIWAPGGRTNHLCLAEDIRGLPGGEPP